MNCKFFNFQLIALLQRISNPRHSYWLCLISASLDQEHFHMNARSETFKRFGQPRPQVIPVPSRNRSDD